MLRRFRRLPDRGWDVTSWLAAARKCSGEQRPTVVAVEGNRALVAEARLNFALAVDERTT